MSKFSNEFNNPKYKLDFNNTSKKIGPFRSISHTLTVFNKNKKNENKLYDIDQDKILNNNDLDKIKKDRKLLELIVVKYFLK